MSYLPIFEMFHFLENSCFLVYHLYFVNKQINKWTILLPTIGLPQKQTDIIYNKNSTNNYRSMIIFFIFISKLRMVFSIMCKILSMILIVSKPLKRCIFNILLVMNWWYFILIKNISSDHLMSSMILCMHFFYLHRTVFSSKPSTKT